MKKVKLILILLSITGSAYAGDKPRVRGNGGQAHGCVTGDTLIKLENNREVAISKISSGEKVLNINSEIVQTFYTLVGQKSLK